MKSLFRYWYLLVLALVLSLLCATGLVLLRKDAWAPAAEEEAEIPLEDGETPSFREWKFSAAELEDMQIKFEAERSALDTREEELERLEAQVSSERADLLKLRAELVALREEIEKDYIAIGENERANLRDLASMYAEMKAPAAVKVLGEMEIKSVVKILTLMPSDASARILGTMAESGDTEAVKRAAEITEAIRKVKD